MPYRATGRISRFSRCGSTTSRSTSPTMPQMRSPAPPTSTAAPMSMAELPRAELDGIARAGRAMGRPDRGNGRRGANEEIHDAAREVAEPAHQCDRLGTGCWRHQAFRGLHDAADSKNAVGSNSATISKVARPALDAWEE